MSTNTINADETRVRIQCARGHAERLVAVFEGAPGVYWHRTDKRTPEAEFGASEFARPSGINGRHRLLCSCGRDERVSREGMRRLLDSAKSRRLTI